MTSREGATPDTETPAPQQTAAPGVVHLTLTRAQATMLLYAARATEPRTSGVAHTTLLGAIGILREATKAHDAGRPLFAPSGSEGAGQ